MFSIVIIYFAIIFN